MKAPASILQSAPPPEHHAADCWFSEGRQVLTITDVCKALHMSRNQVRNFVDQGWFVASSKSATTKPRRNHITLERWSVVAWKLNQLEDQGAQNPPIQQNFMIRYWRGELRKRNAK
jgi:hypothetical protein